MNSTDIWCFVCSSAIRSRICFWIVTSSAVVGSSAIRSLGSQAIAIAIITRCCWPPDICDGNALIRCSGSGMPTSSSSSIARLRALPGVRPMCSRSTSLSWKPTVNTGLSDVIGSWKIIEMSAPRILRSSCCVEPREVAAAVHDLALPRRRSNSPAAADRGSRARSPTCRCPTRRPARPSLLFGMSNEMPFDRLEGRALVEPEGDRRSRTRTSGSAAATALPVVVSIMRPSCPSASDRARRAARR